ncbi:unnamed protein product [Blepharisma stoltei]|uniref:Prefoldin subunit 2 n=1 Tax=Blepharisma stoltei TaxID=1481888 RepID=A0AAU9K689_9CILI|nr:unnamed protein product [Blepharisma stoltei]
MSEAEERRKLYQNARQEYSSLVGKITEIESERKEHVIVLETLKKIGPGRRCWKSVGETLVEKDSSETMTTLEQQMRNIDQILEVLSKKLKETEHQIKQMESEIN